MSRSPKFQESQKKQIVPEFVIDSKHGDPKKEKVKLEYLDGW